MLILLNSAGSARTPPAPWRATSGPTVRPSRTSARFADTNMQTRSDCGTTCTSTQTTNHSSVSCASTLVTGRQSVESLPTLNRTVMIVLLRCRKDSLSSHMKKQHDTKLEKYEMIAIPDSTSVTVEWSEGNLVSKRSTSKIISQKVDPRRLGRRVSSRAACPPSRCPPTSCWPEATGNSS